MFKFSDLVFSPHSIPWEKQAVINFPNWYGVSVVFGSLLYSNWINTYEVAILEDWGITYTSWLTDDVIWYITEDEVSEVMEKAQNLIKT